MKLASLLRGNDRGTSAARVALSGLLVAASTGLGLGIFAPTSANAVAAYICDFTAANQNPYVVNRPSANGDVSGHLGHNGPVWFPGITEQWGDIIPPDLMVPGLELGLNWTAAGQEIYNNQCEPGYPDLQLLKSSSGDATEGATGTYTIAVDNSGAGTAAGPFTVTDTMPVGVVATAVDGGVTWSCSLVATPPPVNAGAGITCTYAGSLAPNVSAADIVVDVTWVTTGSKLNSATVSTVQYEQVTSNNTGTTTSTVIAPTLSGTVVKTSDADGDGTWTGDETTPAAGAAVTFRATVTNTSGVTVSLGALSDTYGAAPGTTITPTCATTPPAALAHNASYTCEFTVAGYTAPTGGSVSNTFSAPLSRAGSNPTTLTGTAVVRTGQLLSGTVVKTVDADGDSTYSASESAPAAGATASFRAVVTNTSGVDVSLGALTDSYGTVVAAPVACAAAAPATLTAAGAGSSFTCEFDIANYAPAAGQSLVNTVEATLSRAGSAPVRLQSTATTVTARPDLQLSKTSSGAAVAGAGGSYFIDVQNVGGGNAAGPFTVTDDLPDGVVATAAASAGGGWACTVTDGGDDVSCTHDASLPSGASADRITVWVQWVTVGTKNNNATVSAASGETALANNTEGDSTVITAAPVPDLQLTKSGPAARTTGQTGDYVLLVQNVGTAAATAPITVTDTLPDGVTVSGPVASGGFACTTAAGVVTCTTQDDLAVGGSTTITLPASFTSAGNKANSATVSVRGDGNAANDTSVAGTSVTDPGGPPPPPPPPAKADLAVKKTGPASVVPGGTAGWALTVTNKGPGNASGFAVTDTLPAGVSPVSIAGTGFSCTTATLVCTYAGVLLPGSSATVTVVGTVSDGVQGDTLANVVVVGPTDATPADNTDTLLSVISRPAAPADLVLEKAAPAAPVSSGTDVVWTITVTNAGGSDASGFAVTDPLAPGLTLVSAAGAGFACGDGPTVQCAYAGPLAPGQAATLVVTTALAEDDTSSSVTNTATAALEGDPTPANNIDSATTGVSVPISGGGEEPATGEPPVEEPPQEVPPPPSALPTTDEESAAPPPTRPATLPFTGSSTDQLLALGAALSLLGLLLALTGRRRRAAQ